jgi:N-acetylglucosaminyldiphosphoundecaprenol N-acetyl-beta-D-mannosaminyltransferase
MNTIHDIKQPNQTLRRREHVVSIDLTVAPFTEQQESIIAAAVRGESRTVCFANVHMVVESRHQMELAQAVNRADWVATDGVPLIWALRSLYKIRQDRVAGMDMMPSLLGRAAEENLPVFFYGSTPDILKRCVEVCSQRFPRLTIAGTISPPFRTLSADEEETIAKEITNSGAKLVFVALGCPKQELWMARMRGRIPAVMLGIGAALPLLVGETKRAPLWVRQIGMEWAFRLGQEPQRLLKRYVTTNSAYLWYWGVQFFKHKKTTLS